MVNFKPIKQVKASDEIGNQLREAIFKGKYLAGDKLPSERELIELFQVSRTVVREAIKGLEASGLIEIKQGATGGAFVKLMTFERLTNVCQELFTMEKMSFQEVCDVRLMIEPKVAELAAKNCTPAMAEKLREAARGEVQESNYVDEVYSLQKVHLVLADMSGNRFLAAIVKSLLEVIGKATAKYEPCHSKVHPPRLHDPIIEAVIAKDEALAKAEMYKHLTDFTVRLGDVEREHRVENS